MTGDDKDPPDDKEPEPAAPDLFTWVRPDAFGGGTYDARRDFARLKGQLGRVWTLMKDGEWRTLAQIRVQTGDLDSEPAISARLRDFRKRKFGAHTVNRHNLGGGLFQYQLLINKDPPPDELSD